MLMQPHALACGKKRLHSSTAVHPEAQKAGQARKGRRLGLLASTTMRTAACAYFFRPTPRSRRTHKLPAIGCFVSACDTASGAARHRPSVSGQVLAEVPVIALSFSHSLALATQRRLPRVWFEYRGGYRE